MQNRGTALALAPLSCSDFINHLLRVHKAPTTLVVCSSREAFLDELRACCVDPRSNSPHSQGREVSPQTHPFLIPTLHLIAKSQSISLAFVPTLPHLRAYLAAYPSLPAKSEYPLPIVTRPGFQTPLLAIWGLAGLHRSTIDHSAQGLSRTMAAAREAAVAGQQNLVLAEQNLQIGRDDGEDVNDENMRIVDPWQEQVPLLSGTIRIGGDERERIGRTCEVGSIVAKWCKFVVVDN